MVEPGVVCKAALQQDLFCDPVFAGATEAAAASAGFKRVGSTPISAKAPVGGWRFLLQTNGHIHGHMFREVLLSVKLNWG
jgi:hypothetical protein